MKGIPMNPNPYPRGRWTPAPAGSTLRARPATRRAPCEPPTELLRAPLRELIWNLSESTLLEEAKIRIDEWVNSALQRETVPALEPIAEAAPASPAVVRA